MKTLRSRIIAVAFLLLFMGMALLIHQRTIAAGSIGGYLRANGNTSSLVTFAPGTTVTLFWSVTDSGATISDCTAAGSAAGGWSGAKGVTGSQKLTTLATGSYGFRLDCTDSLGNTGGPELVVNISSSVTLTPTPISTTSAGVSVISGHVSDATSALSGATVTAVVAGQTFTATTNSVSGYYALNNIPANSSVNLTASATGHQSATKTVTSLSPGFTLQNIDFTLTSTATPTPSAASVPTVTGKVVIKVGTETEPMPGINITLTQANTTKTVVTDDDGNYTIVGKGFEAGFAELSFDVSDSSPSVVGKVYDKTDKVTLINGSITDNYTIDGSRYAKSVTIKTYSNGVFEPSDASLKLEFNGNLYDAQLSSGIAEIYPYRLTGNITGTWSVYAYTSINRGLYQPAAIVTLSDTRYFTCDAQSPSCEGDPVILNLNNLYRQSVQGAFTLNVHLEYDDSSLPVSGLTVKLYITTMGQPDSLIATKTSSASGMVTFDKLSLGAYHIQSNASAALHVSESDEYESIEGLNKIINVTYYVMTTTLFNCQQAGISDGTYYYYCGGDVNNVDVNKIKATIQTEMHSLKQQVPGMAAAPTAVVITSTQQINAVYHPVRAAGCSFPTISPSTSDFSGVDNIAIYTGLLKNSTYLADLPHIIAHEFGHAIDWHKGGCVNYWSTTSKQFMADWWIGSEFYGSDYFTPIKDSTYDPTTKAGHPQEDPQETFASTFHDVLLHASQFPDQSSTTNQVIKDLAKRVIDDTASLVKSAAGI